MTLMATIELDNNAREPAGGQHVDTATGGLRAFYELLFSNGGGIQLEHCAVVDGKCARRRPSTTLCSGGRRNWPPQGEARPSTSGVREVNLAAALTHEEGHPAGRSRYVAGLVYFLGEPALERTIKGSVSRDSPGGCHGCEARPRSTEAALSCLQPQLPKCSWGCLHQQFGSVTLIAATRGNRGILLTSPWPKKRLRICSHRATSLAERARAGPGDPPAGVRSTEGQGGSSCSAR